MRHTASFLLWVVIAASASAQTTVTVRQFEDFLLSRNAQRASDAALAAQLASIRLSQQLTDTALANLVSRLRLGPQSEEQIQLVAAASIFQPPPPAETPSLSPPGASEQNRILQAAREYANTSAQRLPDFLAIRSTRSFDNAPRRSDKKHHMEFSMHFVGARRRQVTVRAGQEVPVSQPGSATADSDHAAGMTTWGEFGPLLTTVLGDISAGSIAWSRWQNGALGVPLAVFHYSVPQSGSHDLIGLDDDIQVLHDARASHSAWFRDHPAYHGDLYIDPETGAVLRITLDAELAPDAPVLASRLAVEYAPVEIGGKSWVCPVRGIAVSLVHNPEMEDLEGGSPERFVNIVSFTDYHKFGSTSTILANN